MLDNVGKAIELLDLEQITQAKADGLSCSEYASKIGCSIGAVYNFCKRNNMALPRKPRGGANVVDMLQQEFGSLIVESRAASEGKLATWVCRCKCGKSAIYKGSELRAGKVKTCGCRIGILSKRNWQGYGEIPKAYWKSMSENAARRGLLFEIEIQYINCLYLAQDKKCSLSGLDLTFRDGSASLDRIDSSKGYIEGNVQWVHKDVNRMKQSFSQQRFIFICERITDAASRSRKEKTHSSP